jgi:hypothetical protein
LKITIKISMVESYGMTEVNKIIRKNKPDNIIIVRKKRTQEPEPPVAVTPVIKIALKKTTPVTLIKPPPSCEEDQHKKPKTVVKVVLKKTVPRTEEDLDERPKIDGSDIVSEYLRKDTNSDLSQEEMIENVEYQREVLVKNRSKYPDKDYAMKLGTIDKLLTKLRYNFTKKNLDSMNEKRIKIDKIVLDKKIPEKQFMTKIDLTGEHDDKDPSMTVVSTGRQFFENRKSYAPVPKELEKIDPARNKNKGFKNTPMPQEMLKLLNFQQKF